jgi:elongation factor G
MTSNRQPWLIEIAIKPKSSPGGEKLAAALANLATGDPTFGFSIDAESRQVILKGIGERQLEVKIDILKCTCKIDVNVGAPQVAYLERIRRAVTVDHTYKKQIGGAGQFARVKIVAEPLPADSGFIFENKIPLGAMPKEYVSGVEMALKSALGSGALAGFPVVDLKVTLIDGAYHDVDSSALAFEIAARTALREALQKGDSALLEPIMKIEVVTPKVYADAVIGDLKARRGQIRLQNMRGNAYVIDAMVPLAEMFGYASALRLLSQGFATFTMEFDHYASVPLPEDDPPFPTAIGMRA